MIDLGSRLKGFCKSVRACRLGLQETVFRDPVIAVNGIEVEAAKIVMASNRDA